jgi:hypothetical protein
MTWLIETGAQLPKEINLTVKDGQLNTHIAFDLLMPI